MITHSVRWISNTHLVKDEITGHFIPKVVISGNYFIRWGEWQAKEKEVEERSNRDVDSDSGGPSDSGPC
jgi:hypothetical protein